MPTASGSTVIGNRSPTSAAASTSPAARASSTISSAAAAKRSASPASARGCSTRFITRRARVCSGGSVSSRRLGGRQVPPRRMSASPVPAADDHVAGSRNAAATSSWRPVAHTPCAGSHTSGAASRIAASTGRGSASTSRANGSTSMSTTRAMTPPADGPGHRSPGCRKRPWRDPGPRPHRGTTATTRSRHVPPPCAPRPETFARREWPRAAWYAAAYDVEVERAPAPAHRRRAPRWSCTARRRARPARWRTPAGTGCCRSRRASCSGRRGRCAATTACVYDADGRCTFMPSQKTINPSARVRSYPVVERHRFVWVWTGDPAARRPRDDPRPALERRPGVGGRRQAHPRRLQLQADRRQPDGPHPRDVRARRAASGSARSPRSPFEVTHGTDSATVTRWMSDVEPPPFWKMQLEWKTGSRPGNVDRWQIIHFEAPATIAIDVGVAPTGTGAPEGDRSQGVNGFVLNTMTPETDRTCHYFWAFARNYNLGDQRITTLLREGVTGVFGEDEEILAAQQRAIDAHPEKQFYNLNIDGGAMWARRLIDTMMPPRTTPRRYRRPPPSATAERPRRPPATGRPRRASRRPRRTPSALGVGSSAGPLRPGRVRAVRAVADDVRHGRDRARRRRGAVPDGQPPRPRGRARRAARHPLLLAGRRGARRRRLPDRGQAAARQPRRLAVRARARAGRRARGAPARAATSSSSTAGRSTCWSRAASGSPRSSGWPQALARRGAPVPSRSTPHARASAAVRRRACASLLGDRRWSPVRGGRRAPRPRRRDRRACIPTASSTCAARRACATRPARRGRERGRPRRSPALRDLRHRRAPPDRGVRRPGPRPRAARSRPARPHPARRAARRRGRDDVGLPARRVRAVRGDGARGRRRRSTTATSSSTTRSRRRRRAVHLRLARGRRRLEIDTGFRAYDPTPAPDRRGPQALQLRDQRGRVVRALEPLRGCPVTPR